MSLMKSWAKPSDNTVGQYTGLTDKNGKKIFEGDIIRWDGEKIAYKIEFVDGCFAPYEIYLKK